MNKKKDLPYMPFYFGDWRKAPEVRALDLDVRMIWFELLGYMWESNERGYLTLNGNAVITSVITKLIGVDISVIEKAIAQMELYGTFSRREDGAIYCRKMVKDEEIRKKKSESGKEGMDVRYGRKPKKDAKKPKKDKKTPAITETITPVIASVITETITPVITPFDNDIIIINKDNKEEELSKKSTLTTGEDFLKKGISGKAGNEITNKDDYDDYDLYAEAVVCSWHYFNRPIGDKPKEETCKILSNYFEYNSPQELIERLKLWMVEFNKYISRIYPGGRKMTGSDSYQSFFHNWLAKQGSKLAELPPSMQQKRQENVKTKTNRELLAERGML